jgi:hypothetical protein
MGQRAISLLVSLCLAISVVATEPSQSKDITESALSGFTYDGISFSTSMAEFARRYPQQMRNSKPEDEKLGVKSFVTACKNGDGLEVTFFNGKLYKIAIVYQAAKINEMGGIDVFAAKVGERLGAFDETVSFANGAGFQHTWNRPGVHRRAELGVMSTAVVVNVIDIAAESSVKKKRSKNLDVGF